MIETERTDWITPHRFIAHLVERRISRVKILLNSDTWSDRPGALPALGLGSLLDLLQTGIGVADPVPCLTDLRWIHGNSAGNFFASRHERAFIFHRFRAFDRKFPMMPELEESVIHGLGFGSANAATTHGIIKHPVAILPRALVLAIGHIMQHRSIPIFSFNWS